MDKEGRLEPRWDRMPYVIQKIGADLIPNLFVYWSCEPKKRFCEIIDIIDIIDVLVKRFGQMIWSNVKPKCGL